MKTLKKYMAVGAALALWGCSPPAQYGEESQAIRLEQLPPNLPDCRNVPNARVTVRHVDGVGDLYVAYNGATPVCIDSGEEILLHFTAGISVIGDSNPMPGLPLGPGESNPMPGTPNPSSAGTVSSNPMPGTDPASSNPMPGHPDYSGQQGYTSGH
jgi:hypothetical protein